jgi:hypothetical protein
MTLTDKFELLQSVQCRRCQQCIRCNAGTIPVKSCSCYSDYFGLCGKESDSIRNRIRVRRAHNLEKMNHYKIIDLFTIKSHLFCAKTVKAWEKMQLDPGSCFLVVRLKKFGVLGGFFCQFYQKARFLLILVWDLWHACSVARSRFSPPDFNNSGGFESCLAGKKYFWRVPNF